MRAWDAQPPRSMTAALLGLWLQTTTMRTTGLAGPLVGVHLVRWRGLQALPLASRRSTVPCAAGGVVVALFFLSVMYRLASAAGPPLSPSS